MRRRYLVIALFGSAVAVCAYFFSGRIRAGTDAHPSASKAGLADDSGVAQQEASVESGRARAKRSIRRLASLPPAYAPLKDVFVELQAQADAGDTEAATRLYRDLNLCRRAGETDRAISRIAAGVLGANVDAMDAARLESYQAELEAVEYNKRALQNLHNLCDGVGDGMLDSLVPNLQKAAELGEKYARACYLQRGPNYDVRSFASHPELLDAYRRSVPSLIQAGIAAGDWKVVDLARSGYEPGNESLLGGVLGADPVQYYRYLKLARFGAEPDSAERLEQELAAAAEDLTPTQKAEADAWAQDTFQEKFRGDTESADVSWDACSFP